MSTNTIISTALPTLLMLAALALLVLLYQSSSERKRLLAGIFLTAVSLICLEIVLLQR